MDTQRHRIIASGLVLLIAGCSTDGSTTVPSPSATTSHAPATAPPSPFAQPTDDGLGANVRTVNQNSALDPGLYYIAPVLNDPEGIRACFTIATSDWYPFLPAFRFWEAGGTTGRVGVGIVNVLNVVVDGCRDHRHANPPIGSSVDALATAMAELMPFRVLDPPTPVTRYGFVGKHLTLTLTDVASTRDADGDVVYPDCSGGEIWSWVAPPLSNAFHGYEPGDVEELWLLDVGGTRLVVGTLRSAGTPPDVIEEMEAVLDSIRFEL